MQSKKHLVNFADIREMVLCGMSLEISLDEIGISPKTYYRYTTKDQRNEIKRIIRDRAPKKEFVPIIKNEFIYDAF